jgi:hypothetical protein
VLDIAMTNPAAVADITNAMIPGDVIRKCPAIPSKTPGLAAQDLIYLKLSYFAQLSRSLAYR